MELSNSSFMSRAIRSALSDNGRRIISTALEFSDTGQGSNGVIGLIKNLGGFLVTRAYALVKWGISKISFTALFNWIVNGVQRIVMFDWNSTDAELDRIKEGNVLATVSVWGSAVGAGLGWLTGVGLAYGVGLAIPVLGGSVLAKTLATNVSVEALQEMKYYLLSAINNTVGNVANNRAISAYQQFRRAIKGVDQGLLESVFGLDVANWIKNVWGAEGAPVFSVANEVEEAIESIDNRYLRTFVESAVDEFFESFIEAGYIIATGLDDVLAQYKLGLNTPTPSQPRAVKFYPDREDGQHFIIQGTEIEVKAQVEELIDETRVLGPRDLGEWVGQPASDYMRAIPHKRKATVIYKSIPGKAFYTPEGLKALTITCQIPDLDPNISWDKLKTVIKPYNWGEWRATANLDNGRQMACYGATREAALTQMERMLSLSTAKKVTLSASQELERDPERKKNPRMMYPYKMKLLVRRYDPDGTSYIDEKGNSYTEHKDAIELWRDEEPDDFPSLLI